MQQQAEWAASHLLSAAAAVQLGVQGILVLDTRKGGPAAKAGIQGTSRDTNGRLMLGDIIVAFNRKPIRCAVPGCCSHASRMCLQAGLQCGRGTTQRTSFSDAARPRMLPQVELGPVQGSGCVRSGRHH
jgi:hypothetical protein